MDGRGNYNWGALTEEELAEVLSYADMSKMAEADNDILLYYGGLDAAAAFQLYQYFLTFKERFPHWYDFHTVDYANETALIIEQQLLGLNLDMGQLEKYGVELDTEIDGKLQEFLNHPEVRPHVDAFNAKQIEEFQKAEPPKYKKDGGITKRWEGWAGKLKEAQTTNFFNTDSPAHLTYLFYEGLKQKVQRTTPKGEPSVDAKALSRMGRLGGLLLEYRKLRDIRKFVVAISNVQRDGVLHPMIKNPATVTSRLGGGVDE